MKNLLVLFGCVLLLATMTPGQSVKTTKSDAAVELRALYVQFLDASKSRNKAALDVIMTDDYTQVLDDGRVRTKEIRMRETMDTTVGTTDVLDLKDFKVRIYGDSAVAVCKVWEKYTFPDGGKKNFDIYSTATFVKQNTKWRIAATHISMIEVK